MAYWWDFCVHGHPHNLMGNCSAPYQLHQTQAAETYHKVNHNVNRNYSSLPLLNSKSTISEDGHYINASSRLICYVRGSENHPSFKSVTTFLYMSSLTCYDVDRNTEVAVKFT